MSGVGDGATREGRASREQRIGESENQALRKTLCVTEAKDPMKKVTSVVSVFALAALLAATGCKKDEAAATATNAAPTASAPSTDTTATAAAASSAPSTGVAECDSYLAALDKYMSCPKIPQASRDAQAASSNQIPAASNWSTLPH